MAFIILNVECILLEDCCVKSYIEANFLHLWTQNHRRPNNHHNHHHAQPEHSINILYRNAGTFFLTYALRYSFPACFRLWLFPGIFDVKPLSLRIGKLQTVCNFNINRQTKGWIDRWIGWQIHDVWIEISLYVLCVARSLSLSLSHWQEKNETPLWEALWLLTGQPWGLKRIPPLGNQFQGLIG